MNVELLWITPDAERIIEESGRTAYKSEDKISGDSAARFIKSLIKRGHESVLEHAAASFRITDFSRIASQQVTRHRIGSFTQKSQRYVGEKDFEYVVPPTIQNHEEALLDYAGYMEYGNELYTLFTEEYAIPKEDARYLLPNGCETEFVMTFNFRQWRHFLKLRLHKSAQWEIRELAYCMGRILYYAAPSVFEDLMEGAESP